MNNLKFRAWKKSANEMLPALSMKGICTNSERLTEEEFDDLIIMQYTGLKDKNGKEVFEGDIVHDDLERMFMVEKYNDGCEFVLKGKYGNVVYNLSTRIGTNKIFFRGRVLGNIYENGELIKE